MNRWTLLRTVMAGLLSSSAWAGSFTVGVEGTDYMPISKGDSAAYSGYAKDLLDAFGAKNGHTFTYKPMPVARLWDEFLVQKSLDLRFPDNAYWNNDAKKGLKITYSYAWSRRGRAVGDTPNNKTSVAKIVTMRVPPTLLRSNQGKQGHAGEVNTASGYQHGRGRSCGRCVPRGDGRQLHHGRGHEKTRSAGLQRQVATFQKRLLPVVHLPPRSGSTDECVPGQGKRHSRQTQSQYRIVE
ncbi:MAG: hypothetical protein IPN06_08040 [Burkholderiales bacterium]|nr:hypothetical protein [Burkholderiales bacterium]